VAVTFTEHALSFACASDELLGIVTVPEQPKSIGVLIAVGGPQYRVGSHRQFLLLARALAKAGYAAMRFDYRGMGDSTGDLRDFEAVNDDIAAAINAFRVQCPDVLKIVLCGLCDAASASLLYWDATQDVRISGFVLLNPWVRSETTLARTHIRHYYGQRLLDGEFWRKLLAGKVGLGRAMGGFVRNLLSARQSRSSALATEAAMPFQKRMARGLGGFSGSVLLILSGNDYTAKEFLGSVASDPAWLRILESPSISRIDLPGADHTFSTAQWRSDVERHTTAWLNDRAESL
jgi:exosortase A-associated hydrolase 1